MGLFGCFARPTSRTHTRQDSGSPGGHLPREVADVLLASATEQASTFVARRRRFGAMIESDAGSVGATNCWTGPDEPVLRLRPARFQAQGAPESFQRPEQHDVDTDSILCPGIALPAGAREPVGGPAYEADAPSSDDGSLVEARSASAPMLDKMLGGIQLPRDSRAGQNEPADGKKYSRTHAGCLVGKAAVAAHDDEDERGSAEMSDGDRLAVTQELAEDGDGGAGAGAAVEESTVTRRNIEIMRKQSQRRGSLTDAKEKAYAQAKQQTTTQAYAPSLGGAGAAEGGSGIVRTDGRRSTACPAGAVDDRSHSIWQRNTSGSRYHLRGRDPSAALMARAGGSMAPLGAAPRI
ncbi:unnamed protein product [Pedinophyceae sp. YPF-701]|nr:unnamed protein product [Pedinophyceae sp. YPF-701]